MPLAAGLLACALPRRWVPVLPLLAGVAQLGVVIGIISHFDPALGLQHTVDESWIPDLGVRYQLGVDGISLFLVALTVIAWLAATAWDTIRTPGAAPDLVPDARPRRDRHPRRLPRPGPDPVRPLLRPDADPVLLPLRRLGDGERGRGTRRRGDRHSHPGGDQDDRLHPGRLAADAGRGDRHRDPRRRWRRAHLLDRRAAGEPARDRQPVLDLLVLRRRLPGEDAGLPPARLDAGRLPGGAASGARGLLRGALQGRAPTASSGSSCRSSPTPRSISRR